MLKDLLHTRKSNNMHVIALYMVDILNLKYYCILPYTLQMAADRRRCHLIACHTEQKLRIDLPHGKVRFKLLIFTGALLL